MSESEERMFSTLFQCNVTFFERGLPLIFSLHVASMAAVQLNYDLVIIWETLSNDL